MGIVDNQRLMKYGCFMVLFQNILKSLICSDLKTINLRPST